MKRPDMRTLFIIGAALAVVALYAGLVGLARDYYRAASPSASVFSRGPEGLDVLFSYLEEIGARPQALKSFDELPQGGTIVVAASGPLERDATLAESDRLRSWVRAGGRLVLLGTNADEVSGLAGGGGVAREGSDGTYRLIQPAYFTEGVGRITVGPERVLVSRPEWVAHAKGSQGQIVVSRGLGDGLVVWVSSVYPATNEGIGKVDDARFITQLVGSAGPVWFDEYHHGYVDTGGPWALLGPGGRSALVLLLGALALVLLARGRRLGPAIEEAAEPAARRNGHVEPLAELYRKAGARPEALAALEDGLGRSLASRHGSLAAGLAHHPEAREALEASSALRRRGGIKEDEFVSAAARIGRVRAEMEGVRDG